MTTEAPRPEKPDFALNAEERDLGMECDITRRDFLNTAALGTGAALLGVAAPGLAKALDKGTASPAETPQWHPWTGYGGVGDYKVSNGDTWEVVNAGHGIRDALYERSIADATPTGETYDLVICGGGFAGVISAYAFLKDTQRQRPCLLLDNHPLIGGEAKRNEFLVRGQRLMGPQGSNSFIVPTSTWSSEMWHDVGLPTEFELGRLPAGRRSMQFPFENYVWDIYDSKDTGANNGYFFENPRPHWVTNIWGSNFEGTPWPEGFRRDMRRYRDESVQPFSGDQASLERWLDTLTYEQYLTTFRKLDPEVARYMDPFLAAATGPASDAMSAYLAYFCGFPGFKGLGEPFPKQSRIWQDVGGAKPVGGCFPGGNDGIMRALVKWLNPEAIEGSTSFADVHNRNICFEAMDRRGAPCRMRAGATVVRVVHDPEAQGKGKPATVIYAKNGKFFSVQARTVIWAGSSLTGKHVVQNLPEEYRAAMESFPRSPMLVVNVALNNWRALYKLGYSACWWRGGFGYTANIRAPTYIGDYRPPLDPDQPTILTFYVSFPQAGLPPLEQGKAARAKLYATSYRDFEIQIRQQLVKLFGSAGFDPKRDIAGIVLNRWGHAYVNAGPGFFFGRNGKPTPSDVLRRPLGNLVFAHSELAGLQDFQFAGDEGVRAARQVLQML